MRRTGAVLASIAAVLLGLPVASASAAAGCEVTALPVPSGATEGGSVTAVLEPGTYLGWTSEPVQGRIWRNGSVEPLPISPNAVNSSGLVVGSASSGGSRAARLRLGGTPEYAAYDTFMNDVNDAGDAVGSLFTIGGLVPRRNALWWRPGESAPRSLPGPQFTGASAIDDQGNKVGYGETWEGERRWLVWGPDGGIVRQYGPYADGETTIAPHDIDDGVMVALRLPATGEKDLVLTDVATGSVTPVPGSGGFDPVAISDGSVVGIDIEGGIRLALWHDGVRYDLPSPPGTRARTVEDLQVHGSTAVLTGFSYPESSGWVKTPTVWRCG